MFFAIVDFTDFYADHAYGYCENDQDGREDYPDDPREL